MKALRSTIFGLSVFLGVTLAAAQAVAGGEETKIGPEKARKLASDAISHVDHGKLKSLTAFFAEHGAKLQEKEVRMLIKHAKAHLEAIPAFYKGLDKEKGCQEAKPEHYDFLIKQMKEYGELPPDATLKSHRPAIREYIRLLRLENSEHACKVCFGLNRHFCSPHDIKQMRAKRAQLEKIATANAKAVLDFLQEELEARAAR